MTTNNNTTIDRLLVHTSVNGLWRLPLTTKVTITAEGVGGGAPTTYTFEDPLTQRTTR